MNEEHIKRFIVQHVKLINDSYETLLLIMDVLSCDISMKLNYQG